MNSADKEKITRRKIKKLKERQKFDTERIDDFITEGHRNKFGHICNGCALKNKCFKWGSSIIIHCEDFNAKTVKPPYKKR